MIEFLNLKSYKYRRGKIFFAIQISKKRYYR